MQTDIIFNYVLFDHLTLFVLLIFQVAEGCSQHSQQVRMEDISKRWKSLQNSLLSLKAKKADHDERVRKAAEEAEVKAREAAAKLEQAERVLSEVNAWLCDQNQSLGMLTHQYFCSPLSLARVTHIFQEGREMEDSGSKSSVLFCLNAENTSLDFWGKIQVLNLGCKKVCKKMY